MIPAVAYVAAGAAIGGMSRYGLLVLMSHMGLGLLLVNTLGGLLAGAFVAFTPPEQMLRLLLLVGFLGGFTTLSSVTVEVLLLFQQQLYLKGLGTLLLHNMLALGGTVFGYALFSWLRSFV